MTFLAVEAHVTLAVETSVLAVMKTTLAVEAPMEAHMMSAVEALMEAHVTPAVEASILEKMTPLLAV
jgi:hypothetical protein